jgi:2-polyprenyl-3-methyl-5-hydroxy-6-metoxy-1,4-benzoquinol methylase
MIRELGGWSARDGISATRVRSSCFALTPSGFLGPEVDELTPGRALDLGSGEGRNALWLAERGWRVTGVDFSEVGAGKAYTWPASVA